MSLLLLAVLLFFSQAQAAASDWSTFKGSTDRNAVITDAFPEKLSLVWQHRLPATITASPVISGDTLLAATDNGVLYAFSLEHKRLIWAFDSGGAIRSTPAVNDGQVYFLSQAGAFYSINLSDGAIQWSFETQGESTFAAYNYLGVANNKLVKDAWDLMQSSPLVVDNLVVFGSSDHHVYALNTETGNVQWAFKTGGHVHSSPTLLNDLIVVGSWDSAVYAIQHADGVLRWKFDTESEQRINVWRGIQASPTVVDDTVFIGSRDGYMYALTGLSGEEIWRYDMRRSWVVPTVSVDDLHVYLGTSDTGLMLALHRDTGEEAWRALTGAWTYSSPLVFSNAVLTATMTGRLLALDKMNGSVIWESRHGAYLNDVYQILGENDRLRRDMSNGTWQDSFYGVMARVMASGGFMGSPAWVNQQLILLSTAGEIMIWDAHSSEEK
ncbi:PQQ-like beta-propeller repeat protein [Aliidiomarina halalkaliphila]|uniref:PQQ-like beta-propeller repeat protein n=1 Tax=Aliidiomarina halalkaliphila TaxID=2593535 RepID=A0A552X1M7_9GAMM|nr:PQQ-binding-like beta-propeller repeat protein [Aliidiomarina halalkaliphila]TRW48885.1 PQQ-like beta-propeller repeat protein [Aliidiomarina halalkaliphila]